MKAQLENILAELDAIDKIKIDSMGVMMDVLLVKIDKIEFN